MSREIGSASRGIVTDSPSKSETTRAEKAHARREVVLDMWAAGSKSREIAAATSMTCNGVRGILCEERAAGEPRAVLRRAGRPTATYLPEVLRLRAAGIQYKVIARRVGGSPAALGMAARRALARHPSSLPIEPEPG
jgi:DNA-binding CsgD family transcriptional regulator